MPGKRITRRKNGRTVSSSYIRPTLDQRIDAAARLLDRGWGKAKEIIELTGEASPAQRLELLRRLVMRIARSSEACSSGRSRRSLRNQTRV